MNSYFESDADRVGGNKEDNLSHWMLSDEQNMIDTFGEQLVGAVKEALSDD